MFLEKSIALLSGVAAEHWRIQSIELNFFSKLARIFYCGYTDEATFDAYPNSFLERRELQVVDADFDTYFGTPDDVITQARAVIMALDADLSDATITY